MFELAQLRCFTTLASELNFRRAAERLNMTQPPLSRQIQLLEHQLGVALFTRSTRSVALTAAGRAFFVEAQALLDQAHRAAQRARSAALGESGSLTISFVASAVYDFLPRAITQIRRERPGVAINLLETPPSNSCRHCGHDGSTWRWCASHCSSRGWSVNACCASPSC